MIVQYYQIMNATRSGFYTDFLQGVPDVSLYRMHKKKKQSSYGCEDLSKKMSQER